jgi:hypothetical protein
MIVWDPMAIPRPGGAAELSKPEELRAKDHWMKAHVLEAKDKMPFSFVHDGTASDTLLAGWPKKAEIQKLDTQKEARRV